VIIKKKVADHMKHIIAEIDVLKKVDHPNIVKLYEYYTTRAKIILVQEFLKGDQLYKRLEAMENLDEEYARKLMKQILEAINFLHKHNIAHRDIKPENFVFEHFDSDNLKLIDFGLSSPFQKM
jgi:calcium-dependent protein kinase